MYSQLCQSFKVVVASHLWQMADAVYNYLCTGDSTGIAVPNDKVPSHTLRFALEKVSIDIVTVKAQ